MPLHQEEGAEHVADRLAESVGRVLHAGGLLREAAIPGIGEAHPAVVEAPDEKEREQGDRNDDDEKDDRRVAGLLRLRGDEPQPARIGERLRRTGPGR